MIKDEVHQVFGNKTRLRVCGLCIIDNRALLLKHEGIGKGGFLWAPPGGGCEFGSSLSENLRREFKEETSLDVEIGPFLGVNEYLHSPLHAVELFFQVDSTTSTNFQLGTDPELSGSNNPMLTDIRLFTEKELVALDNKHLHNLFWNGFTNLFDKKSPYSLF